MAFTSLKHALSDWLKKRKLEKLLNQNKTLSVRRTGLPAQAGRKKIVT